VFEHFWRLALRLNNEHLNCLKVIHTDQQFFAPRIFQQNKVVERNNCTLVKMDRMMLNEHRTLMCFWTDAQCSVQHRTPTCF
jgi:hypothetical protein